MASLSDEEVIARTSGKRSLSDAEVMAKPAAPVVPKEPTEAEKLSEAQRRMVAVGHALQKPVEAISQISSNVAGKGKRANQSVASNARAMEDIYRASEKDAAKRPVLIDNPALLAPISPVLAAGAWGLNKMGNLGARGTGTLAEIAQAGTMPTVAARGAIPNILAQTGMGALYGGLNPVVKGDNFAKEKAEQMASGGLLSGALSGVMTGISKAIPGIQARMKKPEELPRPTSEGAARAVDELQAQKQIREGAQPVRNLADQSAYEAAIVERDKITKPLLQAAFKSGQTVDPSASVAMIDSLTAKNPDKTVRAALKEVRDTIERATESGSSMILPAAGARLSVSELKALQGQQGKMSVAMADEVRQSINRLINAKGEKALDKHTKDVLGKVRDQFLENTPESYKKYLSEYARLSKPLDEFGASGATLNKVTADPAAFHLLTPADKQNLMNAAFKSDTPGRALSELVRDTKHNPEALKGVREAYTDFLTQADPMTKLPTGKGLISRWEDTREAVKSSGLMTKDHIASMDKIMDDLRVADTKGAAKRAWATTAGWITGSQFGHPIAASHAARELVMGSKKEITQAAMRDAMVKISGNPEAAKIMASPPTVKNLRSMMLYLPEDVAADLSVKLTPMIGTVAGGQRPRAEAGARP